MILAIQLTETQDRQLRRKAALAGEEPAAYLLRAAGIADVTQDIAPEETSSAYDLFKDLIGDWGSGGANLSEDDGAAFAEGMQEKRQQGHL